MKIILTHPNADFDAVASMLGAHKLDPDAVPLLPDRLNRDVREFIALYRSGLPFLNTDDVRGKEVTAITLVDTQRVPDMKGLRDDLPLHIIDHHPIHDELPPGEHRIEPLGATVTLLVEQMQARGVGLGALEATLMALGLYADTGSLTYGATTVRDLRAAAWLLEQHAALDTVRRFLSPPLTPEQLTVLDRVIGTTQTRDIQGYTVTVAPVVIEQHMQVNTIAQRVSDTLDPSALFLVAQMPDYVQLVCRSSEDAIDVGEIARLFEGGGHSRAAAASIDGEVLHEVVDRIWAELEERVRPAATVGDLMSYGVHTVEAGKPIAEIIGNLRRVGHEGYPALDDGRVVGLLTLRDADKALEHGMKQARVRDVMNGGEVTLRPRDSVATLEQVIVESGWGQVPVLDDEDRLIGIVTRTDLIKHWAQSHPAAVTARPHVETDQIESVLGAGVAALIARIAAEAQTCGVNIYMVGGVVRDLLLKRPNYDIDFVVEGIKTTQAIDFAERLKQTFGGTVSSYQPFGTAKWRLDESVAAAVGADFAALPHHVDFATSRNEFYEQPTALPTVYAGSIKLDLHRRDFTINTLAIQLSPAAVQGRLLDFYGGLGDLQNGLIRVLHSLSFVDDPTRILRAVRFEQRLNFRIEPRTAELISNSLPMLRRITGERIRNELLLLLAESRPERGLLELRERAVLQAIHPAFTLPDALLRYFEWARGDQGAVPDALPKPDLPDLYLTLALAHRSRDEIDDLTEHLRVRRETAELMMAVSDLLADPGPLNALAAPASAITRRLDAVPEGALLAAWILFDDPRARDRIERYAREWRDLRPATDGHALRAAGLPPGPRYREILDRLRAARLDGEITTDAEEQALLQSLIEQEEPRS